MDDVIRTALYVRHQTAADLAHWSAARDIPWNRVHVGDEPGDEDLYGAVRQAAVAQAIQVDRLLALSGMVAADMTPPDLDAALALSIVTAEVGKHFHALRLYLDRVQARPHLSDREVEEARRDARSTPQCDPVRALVLLMRGCHIEAQGIRTLAARARGPVLRDLLRLIAADKVRHGRMAADLLERWVESDRRIAARVRAAARSRPDSLLGTDMENGWPADADIAMRTLDTRLARICGDATEPVRRWSNSSAQAFAAAG